MGAGCPAMWPRGSSSPRCSTFAAYTGLRPCEFVALKVGRLDLLCGTVRVAEVAPEVAGHLEWGGGQDP